MKNNGLISKIIWSSITLLGLIVALALVAGGYIEGFLLIGGIIYVVCKWICEIDKEQQNKQIEQNMEQKKQEQAELIQLVEGYIQTPNPSQQETQAVWEKYNSILQRYGVEKDGPVFKIYLNVYSFFKKEIPNELSAESREVMSIFYLNLAANLWNFYYQLAFTYDLPPADQDDLLQYLSRCFSGDEEKSSFNHALHFSYGNLELNIWNNKYLALWERGVECGSVFAMCRLADCYYKRIIVDLKDYDKAFSLYQQAAQLGSVYAIYMLGQCYENARGTRRDYQKAGDCYMYAYSNSKNPDCSKALGRLYDGNRWDKNRYSPDIFDCSNTPVMKKTNLAKLKEDMDKCLHTDLDTADLAILAVSVGMISETIIKSFVECYESAYLKADPSEQIELLRNRGYFTKEMFYQTTTVRKLRNRGAHNRDGDPITLEEIKQALCYIREIVEYYEQY